MRLQIRFCIAHHLPQIVKPADVDKWVTRLCIAWVEEHEDSLTELLREKNEDGSFIKLPSDARIWAHDVCWTRYKSCKVLKKRKRSALKSTAAAAATNTATEPTAAAQVGSAEVSDKARKDEL